LLPLTSEVHGDAGHPYADVLSEYANVQRMQDLRKEASETIAKAVQIRSSLGLSEALAKDATLAGSILQEMGDSVGAINYYSQALAFWGALPSSGLQVLTVLDPLAAIFRDMGAYPDTEIYCRWALRLREAALGPKHSELIATLDSLAYALFGQKKYEEAEPVYLRLLALWEGSAGPDHPMVALTLDKMVEFYTAQKLYDKAAPLAQRSQAMRTKAVLESFHRTGRVLIGEQKYEEALDLYQRAIKMGESAKVPDENMDGILRSYALVLSHSGRKQEAAALEKRLKDAIISKADREGTRRPKPVPIKPQ
jgi:tetratricopeptide (TPR) repeat protein